MNVIAINNFQQKHTFKAKNNNCVAKKMLESKKIKKEFATKVPNNIEKNVLAGTGVILGLDLLLKEKGITYCEVNENAINVGCAKSGGFYQIPTLTNLTKTQAQEFVFQSLIGSADTLGGFVNYNALIQDLGRQDLIKRGLKLHTYQLNTSFSPEQRIKAACTLMKKTKIPIKSEELFFVENDAFYYDKNSKTVYALSLYENRREPLKPAIRTCKFMTDSTGKAIGYKSNDWDFYHRKYVDSEYIEQQEPTEVLPKAVDINNNKAYAESFRFGNSYPNERMKNGSQKVLKHLGEKAGIDTTSDNLQYIKFIDKNGLYERRISYYNSATGRSIVYNEDGNYLYQIEYNKNDFGKIVACVKY